MRTVEWKEEKIRENYDSDEKPRAQYQREIDDAEKERKANRDCKREIGRGAKGRLHKKRERERWSQEVEGKIGCAMSISTMTLFTNGS